MPGTVVKNNLSSIEEKLSLSFAAKKTSSEDLARKLAAQSRSILLQRIQFKPAVNESNTYWKGVAEKYRGKQSTMISNSSKAVTVNGVHKSVLKDTDGLPAPKIVLFDQNKLQLSWQPGARKGCGLQNTHNTCFMNSVLQALTYTPAFNNYLASRDHKQQCENRGVCMICVMEEHIKSVTVRNVWTPWTVIKNLRSIAKHFSHGRQEDAHEFLRYFIEAMSKSALLTHAKLDMYSKNTTALHQIFGGYLRSQVKCLSCEHKSNTFDPMLDIALEIKDANNLPQALESFTKSESLFGDNCYSCERCKKKVKALKRFSIHQSPNVLTIQLKRFDMAKLHSKINKPVHFPENINLRPYMSNKQGKPVMYSLYAVLVHSGSCASFGHYYTYAKVPSGQWCLFNDSHVSASSIESVLRQQAYMLFYTKNSMNVSNKAAGDGHGQASSVNGAVKKSLSELNAQFTSIQNGKQNGNHGVVKKAAPTATVPKPPTPVTSQSPAVSHKVTPAPVVTEPSTPTCQPTKITTDRDRQKISFGIKSQLKEVTTKNGVPLVMKIKDGKVVSNTASPPDTSKTTIFSPTAVAGPNTVTPRKLVPYNDNSTSSDEEVETITGKKTTNGSSKSVDQNAKPTENGQKKNGIEVLKPKALFNSKESSESNSSNGKALSSPKKTTVKSKDSSTTPVQFEPILDERLKTTTEVPGAYTPLDRLSENGFKSPPFRNQAQIERNDLSLHLSSPEPTSKLNSTSKWTVTEPSELKSPSLASSSSGSVNSTSEWTVSEEVKKLSTEERNADTNGQAQNSAKPSTQGSQTNLQGNETCSATAPNSVSSSVYDSASKGSVNEAIHMEKKTSTAMKEAASSSQQTDKPDASGQNGDDQMPDTKENTTSAEVKGQAFIGPQLPPSFPVSSISTDSSEVHSHRKKKKKKKKLHKEVPVSETQSSEKKKKKKKKHKHRDIEPGEVRDSPIPKKRSHDDQEPATAEESHGKKRRLSPETTTASKKNEELEEGELEECADTANSDSVDSTDQFDTKHGRPNPDHRRTSSEHEDGRHQRIPTGNTDAEHITHSSSSLQSPTWNKPHHAEKANVLAHLENSGLHGYGHQVQSWSGGISQLDSACAEERRQRKRGWEDDYEEELDKGNTKKVKTHREDRHSKYGNPFQRHQNVENRIKDAKLIPVRPEAQQLREGKGNGHAFGFGQKSTPFTQQGGHHDNGFRGNTSSHSDHGSHCSSHGNVTHRSYSQEDKGHRGFQTDMKDRYQNGGIGGSHYHQNHNGQSFHRHDNGGGFHGKKLWSGKPWRGGGGGHRGGGHRGGGGHFQRSHNRGSHQGHHGKHQRY